MGSMGYKKFISFNVIGGTMWVLLAFIAGFFFGNIPIVEENFTLVIFGIIGVSMLPAVIAYLKEKKTTQKETVHQE